MSGQKASVIEVSAGVIPFGAAGGEVEGDVEDALQELDGSRPDMTALQYEE
jgi:hypothetical protein